MDMSAWYKWLWVHDPPSPSPCDRHWLPPGAERCGRRLLVAHVLSMWAREGRLSRRVVISKTAQIMLKDGDDGSRSLAIIVVGLFPH